MYFFKAALLKWLSLQENQSRRSHQVVSGGLLGLVSADDEHLNRQQTRDLLKQLRNPIHDYECLYEGHIKRFKAPDMTGWPDAIRKATKSSMQFDVGALSSFQGTYAYRNDNSIHADMSIRNPDPKEPLKREIFCLIHGKGSKREIIPDRGGITGPDTMQNGGTIFIKKAYCPIRVDMYPYLLDCVINESLMCESRGWEDVDGHRCLIVDFPRIGEDGKTRDWGERYWIDVTRGGNTLKYEWDDEGTVSSRLSNVRLSKEITLDGKNVCFPVGGRILFYRDGFRATTEVQVEQTYDIIAGTLNINGSLPDSRFSLDYNVDERIRASASVVNRAKTLNRKLFPSDAELSTKVMLRDSDDPAKRLVASSSSSGNWFTRNTISIVLIACGSIVLAFGIHWKRKLG